MPIPLHLRAVKGDECQCGRRKSARHCPSCGSTRLYGYSEEQWIEREGLPPIKARLFRCIACGHRFTDAEREFCEAPPVSEVLARQKIQSVNEARKTGEHLNPVDQRIAQALELVEKNRTDQPQEHVYTENELKNVWFTLRRAWIDLKLQNKGVAVQSLLDFLTEQLGVAQVPQQHIDTILQWQRDETARTEVAS